MRVPRFACCLRSLPLLLVRLCLVVRGVLLCWSVRVRWDPPSLALRCVVVVSGSTRLFYCVRLRCVFVAALVLREVVLLPLRRLMMSSRCIVVVVRCVV